MCIYNPLYQCSSTGFILTKNQQNLTSCHVFIFEVFEIGKSCKSPKSGKVVKFNGSLLFANVFDIVVFPTNPAKNYNLKAAKLNIVPTVIDFDHMRKIPF